MYQMVNPLSGIEISGETNLAPSQLISATHFMDIGANSLVVMPNVTMIFGMF